MNWNAIETERLLLKGIDESDADFVFRHFSNEYVCKYLYDEEPFTSIDQAKQLIGMFGNAANTRLNRWIIVEKHSGQRIGTCGFMAWDTLNNSAELGYDLAEAYCRRGIMTEALIAGIHAAYDEKGINRIQAITYVDNSASCKLLEKLGFKQEGIIREKHYFRGKYYDHFCYSLLKREWKQGRFAIPS